MLLLFSIHLLIYLLSTLPQRQFWLQAGLRPLCPLFGTRPLTPFDIWEGRRGANSLVA